MDLDQQENNKEINKENKKQCTTCIHRQVCMYQEEYASLLEYDYLEMKCKYFKEEMFEEIPFTAPLMGGEKDALIHYPNSCENCSFYRNELAQGKIYVGDSPCNWCNKMRPTCT